MNERNLEIGDEELGFARLVYDPIPGSHMIFGLSIDGGGLTGIIPARILAEIEKRTGKYIASFFDFNPFLFKNNTSSLELYSCFGCRNFFGILFYYHFHQ